MPWEWLDRWLCRCGDVLTIRPSRPCRQSSLSSGRSPDRVAPTRSGCSPLLDALDKGSSIASAAYQESLGGDMRPSLDGNASNRSKAQFHDVLIRKCSLRLSRLVGQ